MILVAIYVIEKDRKILTEWRSDGIFAPGFFSIPGGRLEAGESAPDAVRRELREECGITATLIESLGEISTAYDVLLYPFWIREYQGEIPERTDAGHDLKWLTLEEAVTNPWQPAQDIAKRFVKRRDMRV